jgi:PAS domain-containing protein
MLSSSDAADRVKPHESQQAALDLIDQAFTLMDSELRLLIWNRAFVQMLDLPPGLVQAGASLETLIRFNAERGEYGPGEPRAQLAERMAAARRFVAHDFERTRPIG